MKYIKSFFKQVSWHILYKAPLESRQIQYMFLMVDKYVKNIEIEKFNVCFQWVKE